MSLTLLFYLVTYNLDSPTNFNTISANFEFSFEVTEEGL